MTLWYINLCFFKSLLLYYNPGLFSSRPWKLSHWNVIIQDNNASFPQSLWEGRSLTWVGALLQVVKQLPIIKIQESLIFLWWRPISKHKWPAIPLTLTLRNPSALCFSEDEFRVCLVSLPPLQYPWAETSFPIHICLVQLLSQFLSH